jgi:gamma-glutamyltranspeptidase/glutathione hydrolase
VLGVRIPWLVGGAGVVAVLAAAAAGAPPLGPGVAVVSADHRLASEAGAAVLAAGGNAADAAVAAALSAGVVQPAGSGLGGGGFAVGRGPDGAAWVLDFRETAPAAATRDLFLGPDGKVVPAASTTGGLAVAVPSESRGLAEVVRRFGRLTLRDVAGPAIRQAEKGFEVGPHLAGALAATEHPAIRSLFAVDGHPAASGERVTNPELGRTLRRWVRTQGEDLHHGAGAEAIVAAARESGGVLEAEDLAAVDPKDRTPLVGTFRGRTVVTMPPPSSGGVALLQLLAVLEPIDLGALGHNSAAYVHLLAEAFKHAYADRAHHLGDPDFVDVPVDRLVSAARADEIRRDLSPDSTWPPEHYGTMVAPVTDHGTQHISVLDAAGGAVALTTTINTSFGSGLVPESLGLVLNDQMDDFAAAPGVPNAFGLVHDEANAIAPHKRPLSSMLPTVVSGPDGRVELVVGASGGSQIISGTLEVLLDILVFGMDPQEAVAAPRFHHQWIPDVLLVEPGFPPDVVAALEARGHVVQVRPAFSSVQVVAVGPEGPAGGCDPRKGGAPATVP